MELYHRLYLVCLWGMGVCAAVSAVLFVRLDIRSVLRVLAGAPAKERIKKKGVREHEFFIPLARICFNYLAAGGYVCDRGATDLAGNREGL